MEEDERMSEEADTVAPIDVDEHRGETEAPKEEWEKYVDSVLHNDKYKINTFTVLQALITPIKSTELLFSDTNPLKRQMCMLQEFLEENHFDYARMISLYPPPKVIDGPIADYIRPYDSSDEYEFTRRITVTNDGSLAYAPEIRADFLDHSNFRDISGRKMETDNSKSIPRKTDNSDSIPRKTDNSKSIPRKTDNSDSIPRKADNSNRIPQKTDNLNPIPQKVRDAMAKLATKKSAKVACSRWANDSLRHCSWQSDNNRKSSSDRDVASAKVNTNWKADLRAYAKSHGFTVSIRQLKDGEECWQLKRCDFNAQPILPVEKSYNFSQLIYRSCPILHNYYMSFFLRVVAIQISRPNKNSSVTVLYYYQLAVIKKALHFYVLTAIRPYADEGVILRECDSTFPSLWKPTLEDKDLRIDQLERAVKVFELLIDSYGVVCKIIMKEFLLDYICLNEQLIELRGVTEQTANYLTFLTKISKSHLLESLLDLMVENKPKPKWLTNESVLDYLRFTIGISEKNSCGDPEFLQSLAEIFIKIPSAAEKANYYSFLMKEFQDAMEGHHNAERIATCFAFVLDKVPEKWSTEVMAELLRPWEVLQSDSRLKHPLIGKPLYTPALDRSLKILSLYMEALPRGMCIPYFSKFKELFTVWIFLYASAKEYIKQVRDTQDVTDYTKATVGIEAILSRVFRKMASESVDEAEFIVRQIENVCENYIVELRYMKREELYMVKGDGIGVVQMFAADRNGGLSEPAVFHFQNIEIVLVKPNEPKDVFVRFGKGILEVMHQRSADNLLRIQTAILCMKRLVELDSANSHGTAMETDDGNAEQVKQKLSCFLTDLLYVSPITAVLSDKNLANVIDIPTDFLNVTTARLKIHIGKKKALNVRLILIVENRQLELAIQRNVDMAINILYCVVADRNDEVLKFRGKLQRAANVLRGFIRTVRDMGEICRMPYGRFVKDAYKVLHLLKDDGIKPRMGGDDTVKENNEIGKTISFQEIYTDLLDDSVSVRGHALIMLTERIQKKDKKFMDGIDKCPWIINEVIKLVANADSYLHTAAINALVELAYWKQKYFDEMVEFFENPRKKITAIVDSKMICSEDDEADTYLLMQRVKLAEVISSVNKIHDDETVPINFDRLINSMLSLLIYTSDDEQRATILSSLFNLVISCRGSDIHKHFVISISKADTSDAEVEEVHEAAANFVQSTDKKM